MLVSTCTTIGPFFSWRTLKNRVLYPHTSTRLSPRISARLSPHSRRWSCQDRNRLRQEPATGRFVGPSAGCTVLFSVFVYRLVHLGTGGCHTWTTRRASKRQETTTPKYQRFRVCDLISPHDSLSYFVRLFCLRIFLSDTWPVFSRMHPDLGSFVDASGEAIMRGYEVTNHEPFMFETRPPLPF